MYKRQVEICVHNPLDDTVNFSNIREIAEINNLQFYLQKCVGIFKDSSLFIAIRYAKHQHDLNGYPAIVCVPASNPTQVCSIFCTMLRLYQAMMILHFRWRQQLIASLRFR